MTGQRIAVITPYYREPIEMLDRCHRSVLAQGVAADHFMIADGHPLAAIDDWQVHHVKLPTPHGDYGNTPRGLASLLAASEGYDFIAWLDADNWYHDGHLHSLLDLWDRTRSPAVSAFRTFHDDAGGPIPIHELDEDDLEHVDTSCFLLNRAAFDCLPVWLDMPKVVAPICDRIFLAALRHRTHAVTSTRARTVAYRSQYKQHYLSAGLPVPAGAKDDYFMGPLRDYLVSGQGRHRLRRGAGLLAAQLSAAIATAPFWHAVKPVGAKRAISKAAVRSTLNLCFTVF